MKHSKDFTKMVIRIRSDQLAKFQDALANIIAGSGSLEDIEAIRRSLLTDYTNAQLPNDIIEDEIYSWLKYYIENGYKKQKIVIATAIHEKEKGILENSLKRIADNIASTIKLESLPDDTIAPKYFLSKAEIQGDNEWIKSLAKLYVYQIMHFNGYGPEDITISTKNHIRSEFKLHKSEIENITSTKNRQYYIAGLICYKKGFIKDIFPEIGIIPFRDQLTNRVKKCLQ